MDIAFLNVHGLYVKKQNFFDVKQNVNIVLLKSTLYLRSKAKFCDICSFNIIV